MKRGKVLINGAGGFLGSHTAEAFAAAGYELRLTDLPGMSLDWAKSLGECVSADLRDFKAVCDVVDGVDAVVNVAGIFDFSCNYDTLYDGNVRVTEHMCRAALEAGVEKFVHVATIGVYGLPAYSPMDENGPKRPKNNYELTKKLGEDTVWEYQRRRGLPAAILRPGPIYGPRSKYTHSLMFATQSLLARAKKPITLVFTDGPYCSHVHVHDVARAAVHLMQLPRTIGHAYNCCDRPPLKWNDLFELVAELTGPPVTRRFPWSQPVARTLLPILNRMIPKRQLDKLNARLSRNWQKLAKREGFLTALAPRVELDTFGYLRGDHVYDVSALAELGFEWSYPSTIDGLRDTYEWLVENRWIPPSRANGTSRAA